MIDNIPLSPGRTKSIISHIFVALYNPNLNVIGGDYKALCISY